jgi:hypothetical protein
VAKPRHISSICWLSFVVAAPGQQRKNQNEMKHYMLASDPDFQTIGIFAQTPV